MPSPRQVQGTHAETAAAEYLQAQGYSILGRHITSRFGEIDILARDGDTLVAVEVKARRNRKFGIALEGVTKKKLEAVETVLAEYIQKHAPETKEWRVDVVTIDREAGRMNKASLFKGVGME